MNNKSGFGIINILIIVMVIIGISYFAYTKFFHSNQADNNLIANNSQNLKTFRSEKYGFEFQYPDNLAPITITYKNNKSLGLLGCNIEYDFYKRDIVDQNTNRLIQGKDLTNEVSYHSLCIIDDQSHNLQDLPEILALKDFRTIRINDLKGIEYSDASKALKVLLIELPSKTILVFTNIKKEGVDSILRAQKTFKTF